MVNELQTWSREEWNAWLGEPLSGSCGSTDFWELRRSGVVIYAGPWYACVNEIHRRHPPLERWRTLREWWDGVPRVWSAWYAVTRGGYELRSCSIVEIPKSLRSIERSKS